MSSTIFHALNILHDKGPVSVIEAALRLRPSLALALAIIHSSLLHFNAGVTSAHLVNWVVSNDIPYMNVFPHLPPKLREDLIHIRGFFSSKTFPKIEKIDLYSELLSIASGVSYPSKMVGTVDNAPLMITRFAADLNLPQGVLDTATTGVAPKWVQAV